MLCGIVWSGYVLSWMGGWVSTYAEEGKGDVRVKEKRRCESASRDREEKNDDENKD